MRWHLIRRNEGAGPWWLSAEWDVYAGERARTILKGWWTLGRKHTGSNCEAEVAVGGEDNMLQVGVAIPWVARAYAGVRVPRAWTEKWVYERREWAIKPGYIGDLVWLRFAYDDSMADMHGYYRKRVETPDCANCGHSASFHDDPKVTYPHSVKKLADVEKLAVRRPNPGRLCITDAQVNHGSPACNCVGYVAAEPRVRGLMLWTGWQVKLRLRLRDMVFGRTVMTQRNITERPNALYRDYKGDTHHAVRTAVPMPERVYECLVYITEDTWQRPRLPWPSQKIVRAHVEMKEPIPIPGKGESEWDLDEDATSAVTLPARSISEAVGKVAESALERRERYGGRDWRPERKASA